MLRELEGRHDVPSVFLGVLGLLFGRGTNRLAGLASEFFSLDWDRLGLLGISSWLKLPLSLPCVLLSNLSNASLENGLPRVRTRLSLDLYDKTEEAPLSSVRLQSLGTFRRRPPRILRPNRPSTFSSTECPVVVSAQFS
ncbi:unnamed protein product [Pseudo-nitzschia multistriata]|uniref:Uncharacterized protein n=1 Tax=Pseudo-nitzschia multistriata TaxID=183589 RepID=A0A448ZDX1_9STRA|nr:unnamed protein product [Pseudo-nitzschia multistriata]